MATSLRQAQSRPQDRSVLSGRHPAGHRVQQHPAAVLQRAQSDPQSLTPSDVLTLQRSAGNRATAQLLSPILQPKLTLGPAGDTYEQEADQVAKQVVSQINAPAQRQEDETEMQMKPVGALQRQEEEELQMKPVDRMQRQEEEGLPEEGEELQMKALHGPEGGEVESTVEETIQSARGGGNSLDEGARRSMEGAFSADFSSVRVHTDSQSDALNRSLNARAFTVGNDVFFRSGEYSPGSGSGQELLAHELTHTIQQGAVPTSSAQRRTFRRR